MTVSAHVTVHFRHQLDWIRDTWRTHEALLLGVPVRVFQRRLVDEWEDALQVSGTTQPAGAQRQNEKGRG